MIYLIGEAPKSLHYAPREFLDFVSWVRAQKIYQLDIETNMTDWWCDKKLITVQFGSHTDDTKWVIQVSSLTPEQWEVLVSILRDPSQLKLIHNAVFECVVLRFHGIVLENVYDTLLAEKVLMGGIHDDEVSYSLLDLTYRYVGKELDKTEQTNFGDDILTESKVIYAAEDVTSLSAIYRMQVPMLGQADLDWVAALEMEALIAYSEMTYHGLELDKEAWRANYPLVKPLIVAAKAKLDAWLTDPVFAAKAKALGFVSDVDRLHINWNSPQQKKGLLRLIFPDLEGASVGVIKAYVKKNQDHPFLPVLKAVQAGDYLPLETELLARYKPELIEHELLTPAGVGTINWNGQFATLEGLFKLVEPKLKNLSKESLEKTAHPIFIDLKEYKDNLKLMSSYGEAFIKKFVEPDGKVRTQFNQVVSTGRVSSMRPNMQNIPAKETVGNRYRNCFIAPPGWKFVDSDFASQELVCIAYLSKDPVWAEALRLGQDLHSVAAEVVYKKKWKDAAQEDCAYYAKKADGTQLKEKCKCKKHKTMRQACKSINFGLAYGMSEFKLAGTLKISVKEAKALIGDYFAAFPRIEALLDFLGKFGVRNGFSRTMAPFFRKRYYPFWEANKPYIRAHLEDIEYNKDLGSIERASKNHPIQGSSADMIKLSTILIMWHIKDNNLEESVRFVVQVHDQNTTLAKDEIAEAWKPQLTSLMEAGAAVFIPTGQLKSETNITTRWSK